MQLTTFSDYALRVLIYLAMRPGEQPTIGEIAEAYGVSKNHLMKVVNRLSQESYIKATRGGKGGICLNQAADEVNIGEVLRKTEANVNLAECFGPDNRCVITPTCRLQRVLAEALNAFFSVLDDYWLSDMVSDPVATKKLLDIDVHALSD